MLRVSELYIYPIKSLGGIKLEKALVTDRGFEYDRRWMLIDTNNRFISQREIAEIALLQVEILQNGLKIYHKINQEIFIEIPFEPTTEETITADIWDTPCEVQIVSDEANTWFSKILNTPCRLVYMPDSTRVKIDERYDVNNGITSLSDGYPILMISEESLQELNNRMNEPLPMNRFRPNLVCVGGNAFVEDTMREFDINGNRFFGVKPCARCVMTTINQQTSEKGKEPLFAA